MEQDEWLRGPVWINPPFRYRLTGDLHRRFHPEAEPGRYRLTPELRAALDRLFPGGWWDAYPNDHEC